MNDQLVNDVLWQTLESRLRRRRYPKGGRPPVDDRACMEGILYVLRSGCAWGRLPKNFPPYATCWRRLRQWTQEGVWARLQQVLLQELEDTHAIDWSRAVIDSASMRALFGGRTPARTRRTAANKAANGM
jgi:transposase